MGLFFLLHNISCMHYHRCIFAFTEKRAHMMDIMHCLVLVFIAMYRYSN